MLTVDVRSRVEPELKQDAAAILKGAGLDVSTAIRLFLRSVVESGGLPIQMPRPSAKTMAAIKATKSGKATDLTFVERPRMAKEYYLHLRKRYRPSRISTIFVLESPPASGKYFYDANGEITEPLFSAMMKLVGIKPRNKQQGLDYFSSTGHFLVDATYEPVNTLGDRERNDAILKNYDDLVSDLQSFGNPKKIDFVLIKANICHLLESRLKSDGFNVINNGVILPFPSTGHSKEFLERIPKVYKFKPH